MNTPLDRRQWIDLALAARQKFLSAHTGFVHYCHEGPPHDTVPLFENLCVCLALFRSKQSETIQEAKNLLSRLLAFAVDGDFPFYLHNYPYISAKNHLCSVPLYWIDREFGHLVDTDLKPYIKELRTSTKTTSPESLAIELMRLQMEQDRLTPQERLARYETIAQHWHPLLHRRIGDLRFERRVQDAPETTLFSLYMSQFFGELADWSKTPEAIHLQAALIYPCDVENRDVESQPVPFAIKQEGFFEWTWGDKTRNISLACTHPGLDADMVCTLGEDLPDDRSGALELSLFLSRNFEGAILVNGRRATAFRLEDRVEIISSTLCLRLRFDVMGKGQFMGHIARGSRPNQALAKDLFKAYDTQIGLRTLSRDESCRIRISIDQS